MAWIRLDDQIAHHPKFLRAGPTASWLWVNCIGYAQKFLTDGFVPAEALPTLGAVTESEQHASRLVDIGLLERADGGYQIHDYLDFNESAAVVKERRRQDRVRKESGRNPRGIQTESSRIPAGVPRARADAPAARSRDPIPSHPIQRKESSSSTRAIGNLTHVNGNGDARSKRPVFTGQRVVIHEFMLDDCLRTLGTLAEGFNLHEWFFTIDNMAVSKGLVIPKRDGGEWLQSQLVAEAQRRGIPLEIAKPVNAEAGKLTQRMASMVRRARVEAGR